MYFFTVVVVYLLDVLSELEIGRDVSRVYLIANQKYYTMELESRGRKASFNNQFRL